MNLPFSLILVFLVSTSSLVQALPRLLVYTRTAGYRHESIPRAIGTIESLGNGSLTLDPSLVDKDIRDVRWDTVATEDESLFERQGWLDQFDAIAFVMVTDVDPPGEGTILRNAGIEKLASYIQRGGGFVGVHSASNALYGTPFYGRLVGAFFSYHVELQSQSFSPISGVSHPSINNLPRVFTLQEELYNYRSDPRNLSSPATVLLSASSNVSSASLDPGAGESWRNGSNGPDPHPLAWWREGGLLDQKIPGPFGGGLDDASDQDANGQVRAEGGPGRSWYTSLGHDTESWKGDVLRSHIFGGIAWTLLSGTVKSNNASAVVGQSNSDNSNDERHGNDSGSNVDDAADKSGSESNSESSSSSSRLGRLNAGFSLFFCFCLITSILC